MCMRYDYNGIHDMVLLFCRVLFFKFFFTLQVKPFGHRCMHERMRMVVPVSHLRATRVGNSPQ